MTCGVDVELLVVVRFVEESSFVVAKASEPMLPSQLIALVNCGAPGPGAGLSRAFSFSGSPQAVTAVNLGKDQPQAT